MIVRHRHIAPRLASGFSRDSLGHKLPPHIKRGLHLIAAREHQSVSWVIEQIIYAHFGFTPPRFVGTRDVGVIDPENHKKVIDKVSRDKAARGKAALQKRGTQIIERSERHGQLTSATTTH
jgi:hypothetical protein